LGLFIYDGDINLFVFRKSSCLQHHFRVETLFRGYIYAFVKCDKRYIGTKKGKKKIVKNDILRIDDR